LGTWETELLADGDDNRDNCYAVVVDVCLLVQFLLEFGVLFDGP
jgi:hypothetical protein